MNCFGALPPNNVMNRLRSIHIRHLAQLPNRESSRTVYAPALEWNPNGQAADDTFRLALSPSTYLPQRVSFTVHPDNPAFNADVRVATALSNYQNGIGVTLNV